MQILCEGKAAKKSNNAVPLMPTRGSGEPQQKYVYSLIQKLFWSASLLAPKKNKQTNATPTLNKHFRSKADCRGFLMGGISCPKKSDCNQS